MERANAELRQKIRASNVFLWQIADALHISEATLTRKLRQEISEDDETLILEAVKRIRSADEIAGAKDCAAVVKPVK